MVRENLVRLSDREQELVEEVRQSEFGTDSVPLGEAVEAACEQYLGTQRLEAANLDDS